MKLQAKLREAGSRALALLGLAGDVHWMLGLASISVGAILTAAIGVVASLVPHVSTPLLVLFLVGVFCLAVVGVSQLLIRKEVRFASIPSQSAGEAGVRNDAKVLIRERDELAKEVTEQKEQLTTQDHRIRERELLIRQDRPAVGWANKLVERERGLSVYLSYEAQFWRLALDDPEPYFDIAISLTYVGVLELIIGETQSGRLVWDGRAFSQEPILTLGSEKSRPFRMKGPSTAVLKLRQYVTPVSAAEIRAYLERDEEEMEFWTGDLEISLSKVSFDGSQLANGRLLGEYLKVKGARGYNTPVIATPSLESASGTEE